MNAPAQYGPGVRAVATYLTGAQHLPLARTAQTLADLLGAPVSAGTVAAIIAQAAGGLGPVYCDGPRAARRRCTSMRPA